MFPAAHAGAIRRAVAACCRSLSATADVRLHARDAAAACGIAAPVARSARFCRPTTKTAGQLALIDASHAFCTTPSAASWRAVLDALAMLETTELSSVDKIRPRLLSRSAELPEPEPFQLKRVPIGELSWQTSPSISRSPDSTLAERERVAHNLGHARKCRQKADRILSSDDKKGRGERACAVATAYDLINVAESHADVAECVAETSVPRYVAPRYSRELDTSLYATERAERARVEVETAQHRQGIYFNSFMRL